MDHRVHGPKEPQVLAESSRGKCWQKEAACLAPDVRAPLASTRLRNLRPTRFETSDKSHASGQTCGRGVSDTSRCREARPWPRRVGQVEVSAEACRTSRTRRHTQSIVACRTHPIISERHVATQESRRATSRIRSRREGRPRVEASGRHVEPRLKRRVSLSHAVDPTFRRVATTLELYNLSRSASRRIKTDDLPNEAGCGFLLASTSRSTMTRSF